MPSAAKAEARAAVELMKVGELLGPGLPTPINGINARLHGHDSLDEHV